MKRTLAILILIASPALADDTKRLAITEGQWEITADVKMTSGNAMEQSGPAQPMKLCLTKKSPVPVDPKGEPKGVTCTKKHTVTGNDVAWTASCKGTASTSEGTGTVTYADKTFSGSSESTVKMKGSSEIKVSMKLSGKYLGACPK
jgi:Tfp pilus assembly protein FimT